MGTVSVLGAGLVASPAMAADGIKLSVGGFFREAYLVAFDDDDEGELGNERNSDGLFNDGEIHFKGETTLDNGLTVGARVELEAETSNDQIDEARIFFEGGFGQVSIGSQDDALENSCIIPPGGTANFSAFSPNQWAANNDAFAAGVGAVTSNSVCFGVDDRGDAQKIRYVTPSFGGFQLSVSYTPNGGDERFVDVAGPHIGQPTNEDEESRHNTAFYATYSHEGDGWGLTWGGGASFEGQVERSSGPDRKEETFYQSGLNLTWGNWAVGGVIEYFDNYNSFDEGGRDADIWIGGVGIAYTLDAITVGAQYSRQEAEFENEDLEEFTMQRVVLTGDYALGPGIHIDAEAGYTWLDTDEESAGGVDDYDAFEVGIGTAITF